VCYNCIVAGPLLLQNDTSPRGRWANGMPTICPGSFHSRAVLPGTDFDHSSIPTGPIVNGSADPEEVMSRRDLIDVLGDKKDKVRDHYRRLYNNMSPSRCFPSHPSLRMPAKSGYSSDSDSDSSDGLVIIPQDKKSSTNTSGRTLSLGSSLASRAQAKKTRSILNSGSVPINTVHANMVSSLHLVETGPIGQKMVQCEEDHNLAEALEVTDANNLYIPTPSNNLIPSPLASPTQAKTVDTSSDGQSPGSIFTSPLLGTPDNSIPSSVPLVTHNPFTNGSVGSGGSNSYNAMADEFTDANNLYIPTPSNNLVPSPLASPTQAKTVDTSSDGQSPGSIFTSPLLGTPDNSIPSSVPLVTHSPFTNGSVGSGGSNSYSAMADELFNLPYIVIIPDTDQTVTEQARLISGLTSDSTQDGVREDGVIVKMKFRRLNNE